MDGCDWGTVGRSAPKRFLVEAEGISTYPRIWKKISVERARRKPTRALSCCHEYARMLRLDDDGRAIFFGSFAAQERRAV
jgi:hypothetical protein